MAILEFILIMLFVCFMVFLVIGFNRQMSEKAKAREERFKKFEKGDKNE